MRRTGALLVSIAVALVGTPAVAASAAAAPAVGCTPTALPVPPEAPGGGSVYAILEQGTYLGWVGDPGKGRIWRNGVGSQLAIVPHYVNAAGLVVGTSQTGSRRAARMQLGAVPEYGPTNTSMDEVNASGDAVGGYFTVAPYPARHAMRWLHGQAAPTNLPGPPYSGAWAIDDLGYMVGYGETAQGQRRELIWGPDGQILRQFGPYAAGDTKIYPTDIDDGVALATRQQPNGARDLVLVDAVTGAITPLAGTNGLDAELYRDGWVVGSEDIVTPVVWHNGARLNLPALPNTSPRAVYDLKVFGSTAVIGGFSYPASSGWFQTPTIWQCS